MGYRIVKGMLDGYIALDDPPTGRGLVEAGGPSRPTWDDHLSVDRLHDNDEILRIHARF